jgi:pimeloyl-ACP methyl ester carboxylesterase
MLARLQQVTTLGGLLLAVAWAMVCAANGHPLWAATGSLLIVFGYALVLAVEFVMHARVSRGDPSPRATPGELFGAWVGEVATAPRVFCWRQPFRAKAEPDHLPTDGRGRLGIVFVHGFVCNRALWNPWMARLRRAGVPFLAVDLEPVFGSLDDYPATIDKAVSRVRQCTHHNPLIVAHSMGGLATRAWLSAYDADHRIAGVVTIGTPHRGTWLARFAVSRNARQMGLGSAWLHDLAQREPRTRAALFTCFYSHCDNISFPPSSGCLEGASNRHVRGTAHVHLAFHAEVFAEVWRRVCAPLPLSMADDASIET